MRATEEHLALMREEVIAATRALSAEFGDPVAQPADRGRQRRQPTEINFTEDWAMYAPRRREDQQGLPGPGHA